MLTMTATPFCRLSLLSSFTRSDKGYCCCCPGWGGGEGQQKGIAVRVIVYVRVGGQIVTCGAVEEIFRAPKKDLGKHNPHAACRQTSRQ